jgi:hypothetical protein
MTQSPITGGCLCGAVRYEARGEPGPMGLCFCRDCQKASGSGFIPFMNFPAERLTFHGQPRQYCSPALRGVTAVRNYCPDCGGLVFGGPVGETDAHTLYAGSLDDPSRFRPTMAIFLRDKPDWVPTPEGLTGFATMPGMAD